MHPTYFETEFQLVEPVEDWPVEFFIISAYAAIGERWTQGQNERANNALEHSLRMRNCWRVPLICFSPVSGIEKSCWACALSFGDACLVGLTFRQDAIYRVRGDKLSVTHCDDRRCLVWVGSFHGQLRVFA